MSLTSSIMVGFSGINSNSTAVDTVGNNLANVNTTAFKSQRTLFETLFYQTVREGQAPSGQSGGTLPEQIGFGATVASLQRSFQQGGIDDTGVQSDLAINGNGFFILNDSAGDQVYTRDGSFRLDATQTLVSAGGAAVQVFPADAAGTVATGSLSNLVIPLGTASQAVATTGVVMEGRLDSGTTPATAGAVVVSDPLLTAGGPATGATPLSDLVDANGLPLFTTGDTLAIRGSKGGVATEASDFVVGTTGGTVGDLAGHLEQVLGIVADPAATQPPGVFIADGTDFPAGSLVIRSNLGQINAVELESASITNSSGPVTSPFSFSTVTPAVGGGVTTSFGVFDSLGNPVDVRLRAVLESRSETGTVWRFYTESIGDSGLSPALGTGTITFDANGQFVGATGTNLTIDRAAAGASSPLTATLDLSGLTGLASGDGSSELIMASQNGAPPGILIDYGVASDGTVTGTFSNQQTQVFGQIALATFANNEGLIARGEDVFVAGPNSGDPNLVAPRSAGAGSVDAGALEQSNVEIAREFVNLITASTGISSASRVVRVADDLLQELLLLVR